MNGLNASSNANAIELDGWSTLVWLLVLWDDSLRQVIKTFIIKKQLLRTALTVQISVFHKFRENLNFIQDLKMF